MTGKATSLGCLERLPAEIRYKIYANRQTSSKGPGSVQMLRVNTKAYSEFLESIQRFWRFGVLRLHIDPAKHPSTVQILTEYGKALGSINVASSHLHFDTNPMRNMPIGRYRRIDLFIDAPNPNDPGQAIRLCKQVSAVVKSLSPCWFPSTTAGIPTRITDCLFPQQMKVSPRYVANLHIWFKESPQRSWSTNGKLNKTLTHYDEGWNNQRLIYDLPDNTDMGLVLQLLEQLRRVPIWIDAPIARERVMWDLLQLIHNVSEMSKQEPHFGLSWRHRHGKLTEDPDLELFPYPISSDHQILEKIQSLQIWHEYLLDDLPGRSANLLRKERFLNWCGAYERQHATALYGIPPRIISDHHPYPQRPGMPIAGAHEWMNIDLWDLIDSSFHSRFWAMMSCDARRPTGVERKSKNKLWTEFPERPEMGVHALLGFCVSLDETYPRWRRWRDAEIDCIICKAEAERDSRVFSQNSVRRRVQELSLSSGLED